LLRITKHVQKIKPEKKAESPFTKNFSKITGKIVSAWMILHSHAVTGMNMKINASFGHTKH
jgi:hypothetical protein